MPDDVVLRDVTDVEEYSLILAGSTDNTHDGKEGRAMADGERVDSTNSTNSTDDMPLARAGAEFLLRPDVAF
ncbi:MAG: hypothetical protein ACM3N4_09945, partial [Nitrososphaerota archaeon]